MFYRETAPAENFSPLVLSFWEFTVAGGSFPPIRHEIFPDGCVSLFYHRNDNLRVRRLFFSGLHLETIVAPVFPSDVIWGMRLAPAACASVLRASPAVFRASRVVEAEEFPHLTENLLEELNACENFAGAVEIYENRLRRLSFEKTGFDERVAEAVGIIEETGGEIKIAELAAAVGLSTRQLERRFLKSSGLTPKQFARVRRIRATAIRLVETDNLNWANRAAEMGFSDQAHLVHEFVSVTKRAPNSFAEKVLQIDHGDLVK